jgi:hypothetical protein
VAPSPGSGSSRTLAIYRFAGRIVPGLEAVAPRGKSSDPTTLNAAALVQTCLGRRENAILLLEKSLSLNPDQPGAVQSLQILRSPPKGN